MPGQGPLRKVSTTLRSPFSPALIATLLGVPARWTVWHSVMPRAMPPATGGSPAAGSNRCRPELGAADTELAAGIGAPARSPATEPTARSAGAVAGDGSATCASAAAGAAQRPSALTMSSGRTGPCGPRFTPALTGMVHSGLLNKLAGLENQPPSFWSSNTCAEFLQPATVSAAAQASTILRRA